MQRVNGQSTYVRLHSSNSGLPTNTEQQLKRASVVTSHPKGSAQAQLPGTKRALKRHSVSANSSQERSKSCVPISVQTACTAACARSAAEKVLATGRLARARESETAAAMAWWTRYRTVSQTSTTAETVVPSNVRPARCQTEPLGCMSKAADASNARETVTWCLPIVISGPCGSCSSGSANTCAQV
mmetsp:Transcript_13918/g.27223  ORF Transcript_13918/g.27223 Transcript_13918/m.27223 type:complete len:186 (-) Transcript_13918:1063-1620(-)